MLILLSPAKSMDFERAIACEKFTLPIFPKLAAMLAGEIKNLGRVELQTILKISDKLLNENFQRYQDWYLGSEITEKSRPAIFAYSGIAYLGFDPDSLTEKELGFAQKHLLILSALYGALRPLDLVAPYRLDMNNKFTPKSCSNLYKFWQTDIQAYIAQEYQDIIVNLASSEYSKMVMNRENKTRIITPVFKDFKNGKYKIISSYAKQARGVMARWIVQNEVLESDELNKFTELGYRFSADESNENSRVFIR